MHLPSEPLFLRQIRSAFTVLPKRRHPLSYGTSQTSETDVLAIYATRFVPNLPPYECGVISIPKRCSFYIWQRQSTPWFLERSEILGNIILSCPSLLRFDSMCYLVFNDRSVRQSICAATRLNTARSPSSNGL